jgi:hypothetical protein
MPGMTNVSHTKSSPSHYVCLSTNKYVLEESIKLKMGFGQYMFLCQNLHKSYMFLASYMILGDLEDLILEGAGVLARYFTMGFI